MKSKIVINLIDTVFLLLLGYGLWQPESALLNIAQAYSWLLILLSLILMAIAIGIIVAIYAVTGEQKQTLVDYLGKIFKPSDKSKFSKVIGWMRFVAVISCMAYIGWIVTSIFFAASSLLFRTTRYVAIETIKTEARENGA
ncbi:TPA: hypothetical protein PXP82_001949 [Yersinia enterocolitica]|uniref:hypothetical protein n=1 Tax=Yersinia intermedia TaxID=631 RepID=UPI0005DC0ECA|nr:hypothetical protein [Yersinia intermedia]CNI88543.1 Uncharacterised protein [Yersinia intermedia]HDL7927040.1 hypothetical protein [Yersinia enterocolitica]